MADVSGPFTIEQLDQFGNLDALPFSLDSSIWNTATIWGGSGSVSSNATVAADSGAIRGGAASVVVSASITADGYREYNATASIDCAVTTDADATRIIVFDAIVSCITSLAGLGGCQFDGSADITAQVDADGTPIAFYTTIGITECNATITAVAHIVGGNWQVEAVMNNNWTDSSAASNRWIPATINTNDWASI